VESIIAHLPDARWQPRQWALGRVAQPLTNMVRCYLNALSHVPATKVREFSHLLKAIYVQKWTDALSVFRRHA